MKQKLKNYFTLFILCVICLYSCDKQETKTHVQPGEIIPEFFTYTVKGQNVSSRSLLGKPSVLILFGTRCPDCHMQLPEIESLYRSCGEFVNILAVARNEGKAAVISFWSLKRYTMPVAATEDSAVYDAFDRGSQSGIPQVYVISPEGEVLAYADWHKVITTDEFYTYIINL